MECIETLTAAEVKDLLKGKKIDKEDKLKEPDSSNSEKKKTDSKIKEKPIGSVPLTAKNSS